MKAADKERGHLINFSNLYTSQHFKQNRLYTQSFIMAGSLIKEYIGFCHFVSIWKKKFFVLFLYCVALLHDWKCTHA